MNKEQADRVESAYRRHGYSVITTHYGNGPYWLVLERGKHRHKAYSVDEALRLLNWIENRPYKVWTARGEEIWSLTLDEARDELDARGYRPAGITSAEGDTEYWVEMHCPQEDVEAVVGLGDHPPAAITFCCPEELES